MKSLLEKLAALADELDKIDAPDLADEVDTLTRGLPFNVVEPSIMEELDWRARQQDAKNLLSTKVPCPVCNGTGDGVDSPWCEACGGEGFVSKSE